MSGVEDVIAAIRAGEAVILPVDTVYGLCASADTAGPAEQLYELKGRQSFHPIALVASDIELLFERVPEASGQAGEAARALLPGPFTLVLPNPARRFRWLTGNRPETIGVRVPELAGGSAEVLRAVGAVAATSANLSGGTDPRRLDDVPAEIRARCGAELEAGGLPGVPSTVVDLTGAEPVVLREGAVAAADVLERLR